MAVSMRLLIISSILVSQAGRTHYALENICPVQNPMSYQQKRHILRDHNFYRSRIAQGVGIHPESNKLPSGSNIYRLKWNCRLERLASTAVHGCLPEPTANQLYGQNYAFLKDLGSAGPENAYDTARDAWISSLSDSTVVNSNGVVFSGEAQAQSFANTYAWDIMTGSGAAAPFNARGISHAICSTFTQIAKPQMIRGNSTSIGCSQKQCGQFTAVACLYNSANIEIGATIYEIGEQCKNDSDCTAHEDSNCDIEQGLCVVQQESREVEDGYSFFFSDNKDSTRRLFNLTSENRIVKNLNALKSNKMCSVNTTMADELRSMVLRLHNFRRSSLAKGLVKRIHGNPLPSATNILKLKYNCVLEALAHARAAECFLTENYSVEENGENSAVIDQEVAVTFAGAIHWAIRSWWRQIAEHENVMSKRVIYRDGHAQHPIRHFVQMAWAKTKEVGCGIAKCGEVHKFICRYSPSGIIGQVIYDVGPQCTNCPMNTTCDQDLALCEQFYGNVGFHNNVLRITLLIILHVFLQP